MMRVTRTCIISPLICIIAVISLSSCHPAIDAVSACAVAGITIDRCVSHEHPPVIDKQFGQEVFASPSQAVSNLIAAARNHNQDELRTIFGRKREKMFNSGDIATDYKRMYHLTDAYDARHWMQLVSPKERILFIGRNDEQFPILLLRADNGWWRFDTLKGEEEALSRRVSQNELEVIRMSYAYVKAQHAYAAERSFETGLMEYAQSFRQFHDIQDGLKSMVHNHHHLYRGYYYRILKAQGEHTSGGAKDYVEDGHMTRGFALIAYPERYGDTGIMTFIVDEKGFFYEKDLGDNTKEAVMRITTFDPDKTWQVP